MSAADLRAAGRRLLGDGRTFEPLKPAPEKGAKPGVVATGRPSSARSGTESVLVESDYALREYWPELTLTSTDGLFTLQIEPIKKVMLEGGGELSFKQPAEP